jgi:hypothetical protein
MSRDGFRAQGPPEQPPRLLRPTAPPPLYDIAERWQGQRMTLYGSSTRQEIVMARPQSVVLVIGQGAPPARVLRPLHGGQQLQLCLALSVADVAEDGGTRSRQRSAAGSVHRPSMPLTRSSDVPCLTDPGTPRRSHRRGVPGLHRRVHPGLGNEVAIGANAKGRSKRTPWPDHAVFTISSVAGPAVAVQSLRQTARRPAAHRRGSAPDA